MGFPQFCGFVGWASDSVTHADIRFHASTNLLNPALNQLFSSLKINLKIHFETLEKVSIDSALRGGAWNNNSSNCTSAYRNYNNPDNTTTASELCCLVCLVREYS